MYSLMIKRFLCWLCVTSTLFLHAYDVTIVGSVGHADGLARISVGIIDLFKEDLKINCIPTYANMKDLDYDVQKIVLNPDKSAGRVCLFTSPIWYANDPLLFKKVPNSPIKIAYSMLEGTSIPSEWTNIINCCFDAVVVPDRFLIDVYKTAGVTIPIFELPLGMYLDDYLQRQYRARPSFPFVFGTTVSCDGRKNIPMLIQAFFEEFGNQEGVVLKLNSRQGDVQECRNLIDSLGANNVFFTHKTLDKQEYVNFLDSFDCFVNISKGEGFSLCPREAMALGIPCIITQNSSQITLCESGFVRIVPSTILEPTNYWGIFGGQQVGCFSNCTKDDVKLALRDVYAHYSSYLKLAQNGPEWVSQYAWPNLKNKYKTLFKPKKICLGNKNMITEDFLMTDSWMLYKKYQKAFPAASSKVKKKKNPEIGV